MLTPDGTALVLDTEEWLRELRQLRCQAISRNDTVVAEELRAEIAEATALPRYGIRTGGEVAR